MEYGIKRDYKKIDIYRNLAESSHGKRVEYIASTTWAKNLKVAKERAAEQYKIDISELCAEYA